MTGACLPQAAEDKLPRHELLSADAACAPFPAAYYPKGHVHEFGHILPWAPRQYGHGKIMKEINPAGTFTEAITSIEKGTYIVTDWDVKKIYTARIENNMMSAEKEISTEPSHPAGAIWNGKNLFVITWTRSLAGTKFNLLKMDSAFNILKNYEIKKIQEPCQMAWDGKSLWISSWYDRRIYRMDPDTMDVTGYIESPVKKTTGVAWDGKYLWVTGTYSDLYKIELKN